MGIRSKAFQPRKREKTPKSEVKAEDSRLFSSQNFAQLGIHSLQLSQREFELCKGFRTMVLKLGVIWEYPGG